MGISRKIVVLVMLVAFVYGQSGLVALPKNDDISETEMQENTTENTDVTEEDALAQSVIDKEAVPDIHAKQTSTTGISSSQQAVGQSVIEPGDVLEIVILGEEELSRTMMVMYNGTISFPLVGELKVSGLTTEQAAALLTQRLRRYYTHPVVSIVLQSPTVPHVSVLGQVSRQGAIEYQRGLRLSDYVALAGGPTTKAKLGNVRVVRFVNEKPVVSEVDLKDILVHGRTESNFELKSGDWVYVPERWTLNWALVFSTLTLAISALNLYITYTRLE